jgi:DNA polymerase III subunit epsilon
LQTRAARPRPAPLPARLNEQAQAAHREFVKTLGPDALWLRYLAVPRG